MTRLGSRVVVPITIAVLGAAGLTLWYGFNGPNQPPNPVAPPVETARAMPDDPRLTFPTPFRNVKPDVAYVGDSACAGCHPTIDKTYHAHPMGRSAAWVAQSAPLERFDAMARNPFQHGRHELRVDRNPQQTIHRVKNPLGEYSTIADIAIGSGTRGRSYVAVEQGAIWQTPISWFSSDGGKWDLSPGFDLETRTRRAIAPSCLFCHVDRVEPVPLALNRYREPLFPHQASIGCERCHGPGALHVAERTEEKALAVPDTSIVNPRHLSASLRSSICEQCHLQGEARVLCAGREPFDFRPGLPFEQFVTAFVRHPDLIDLRHSVGQFEQMERSRCFTRSSGNLGCTSCHDPHAAPTPVTRDEFYRGRCLNCHEKQGCTATAPERATKNDNCLSCHMPRADSTSIVHASITDHTIPRRASAPKPPKGIAFGADPIVPFRTGEHAITGLERDRAYGIALVHLLPSVPPNLQSTLARSAISRLEPAARAWPSDIVGQLAFGKLLGKNRDALTFVRAANDRAPDTELPAMDLTELATALGELELAEASATRWAKLSPTNVEPLIARATIHSLKKDWKGVEQDTRAALALFPLHPQALLFRAVVMHANGDAAGGRAAAEAIAELSNQPQAKMRIVQWYERLTK